MGKFKPSVTVSVSSGRSVASANIPQSAAQFAKIGGLCGWLKAVFASAFFDCFYAITVKANPAGETVIVTDGGWSSNRFVINRSWEEFLDLQDRLVCYTEKAIRFGLQNPNATTVNVFEYAWNLLEEEL